VREEEGEVESKDCLGEPCRRGKGIETLMPSGTSSNSDRHRYVDQQGKECKGSHRAVWSKWFYVSGIPGRNMDNPYFISAVKQTQQ
jgi:hypothetical protein